MEKWLKRDLDLSEKLYGELQKIDSEKESVLVEQKKLHPAMRKAFALYNLGLATNSPEEMVAGRTEGGRLISEKQNLMDAHRRRREKIEAQLREINLKYMVMCCESLNRLIRQVLGLRKFEVLKIGTDGAKDTPIYQIKNNWPGVGATVETLMGVMERIRNSELGCLSEIKNLYEVAVKNVPDVFDLENEVQGGPSVLARFRDAIGEGTVSAYNFEKDSFLEMNLEATKIIGEASRLKQALFGLKKFFKNATA